jgi:hypothetical protein
MKARWDEFTRAPSTPRSATIFGWLTRIVVRPQLAFGVAQIVTIQSDNAGYPLGYHLAPGALVAVRLPPVLVSAEVRRDMVPGQWPTALTVMLGAGAVF